MKADLFTLDSGSRIVITDEHAASSYGVPVLLLEDAADGTPALGPHDELEPGLPAHLLVSAFLERRLPRGTALRRGRKTRAPSARVSGSSRPPSLSSGGLPHPATSPSRSRE